MFEVLHFDDVEYTVLQGSSGLLQAVNGFVQQTNFALVAPLLNEAFGLFGKNRSEQRRVKICSFKVFLVYFPSFVNRYADQYSKRCMSQD